MIRMVLTYTSIALNIIMTFLIVIGSYNAVVFMESARSVSIADTLIIVEKSAKLENNISNYFYNVLSGEKCLAIKYKNDPLVWDYFVDENIKKIDEVFNTMFSKQLQEDKQKANRELECKSN